MHATRHASRDVVEQFESFGARPLGHQVEGILDHRGDIEGKVFKLHPPGFDLRVVENVIDQGQQLHTRQADGLHVILLLGIKPGVL